MTAVLYTMIACFVLVSFLLMVVVLIQKGRGGGIASAFGGAGGSTAFGSKTGDVLTWVTASMFGVFLLLAIFISLAASSVHEAAEKGKSTYSLPTKNASPAGPSTPAGTTSEPGSVTPSTAPAGLPSLPVAPSPPPANAPTTQP